MKKDKFILLKKGFLAYLAMGKSVDECVSAGLYCAFEVLQRLGCQFPDKPTYNGEPFYEKK